MENLCAMCKKKEVIHENYLTDFITKNLNSLRGKKYLVILYRLAPSLFSNIDLSKTVLKNINIPLSAENSSSYDFIYEIYFNQQNLNICDYEVCDNCKDFICPIHLKFNPIYYNKCKYCSKSWCICMNCMCSNPEKQLCKKIHEINSENNTLNENEIFDEQIDEHFFELILYP